MLKHTFSLTLQADWINPKYKIILGNITIEKHKLIKMKKFATFLFLLGHLIPAWANNVCDSLLKVFDKELNIAQKYIDSRQEKIDSITNLLESKFVVGSSFLINDSLEWYSLNEELTLLYQSYISERARRYTADNLQIARQLGDNDKVTESTIKLGYELASTSNFNEAWEVLQYLQSEKMNKEQQALYYDCMNHLYGEQGFYSQIEEHRQYYFHLADLYDDSLTQVLPEQSIRRYQQLETMARNHHNYEESFAYNDKLLASTDEYSRDYASYAFLRSETYRMMGDEDGQLEWLLRSAIADIRNGITDNGSSWMVAEICYNRGSLKRAYRYIEYSLDNSNVYGAQLRHGQIGPLMSIINNAYQHRLKKQRAIVYGMLAAMTLLLLMVLGMYLLLRHRNSKLRKLHEQTEQLNRDMQAINEELSKANIALREANHIKEEYIAQYLNLYSEYIDRLKSIKKDPEFTQKEIERFYQVFDTTFLKLYPDFVEQFNSLLKEEGQIVLKKGDLLNTELRIFALIRLGIDNPAQISQLLRYSPNTIYNYRAKIKNMALVDREQFEDEVRKIGTFSPKGSKEQRTRTA